MLTVGLFIGRIKSSAELVTPTIMYNYCTTKLHVFGKILFSNSLPNDKTLDCSKLKAFADDNTYVSKKVKFVLGRVENIMGKGENAGYQHFLLFP